MKTEIGLNVKCSRWGSIHCCWIRLEQSRKAIMLKSHFFFSAAWREIAACHYQAQGTLWTVIPRGIRGGDNIHTSFQSPWQTRTHTLSICCCVRRFLTAGQCQNKVAGWMESIWFETKIAPWVGSGVWRWTGERGAELELPTHCKKKKNHLSSKDQELNVILNTSRLMEEGNLTHPSSISIIYCRVQRFTCMNWKHTYSMHTHARCFSCAA